MPEVVYSKDYRPRRRLGYQGLELDILDGKKIDPVRDAAKIKRAVEESRARGIEICAFDTSCTFNHPSLEARHEQVDNLCRWIRLAHDLQVPIIRIFGGEAATATEASLDESTMEERRVAEALHQVVLEAEEANVTIALETHDAFSSARKVANVLKRIKSPFVGAVWNSHHPYRSGESVEEVCDLLDDDIMLIHVKDARKTRPDSDRWQPTLLGEGELPVEEQLRALQQRGYKGYVSVKWGKMWHPEIPEPEVALPQHIHWLKQFPYWQ